MISIKKIMSVIAIAFAVMTIAGSGTLVSSYASNIADPCDASNPNNAKVKGQCDSGIFKLFGLDSINNGINGGGIQGALIGIASFLISIIAIISVIYLIFNAYKMVTDNGDGKNYGAGLAGVKYAIIGLVVALLSFAIVSLVTRSLGGTSKG
jgi:hypothetical protein